MRKKSTHYEKKEDVDYILNVLRFREKDLSNLNARKLIQPIYKKIVQSLDKTMNDLLIN